MAGRAGRERRVPGDDQRRRRRGLSRGARAPQSGARRVSGPIERRLEGVEALLRERELDALLGTGAANLRYLTGYTGSNGLALVAAGGERLFLTDFRYATQIESEVSDAFDRQIGK